VDRPKVAAGNAVNQFGKDREVREAEQPGHLDLRTEWSYNCPVQRDFAVGQWLRSPENRKLPQGEPMPKRPGWPGRPEEPIEWEDISRPIILQPRLPDDRTPDQLRAEESARQLAPRAHTAGTVEPLGCGILAGIAVFCAVFTLTFSVLVLLGGKGGEAARRLIQGPLFAGPPLTPGEVWSTLVAPSLVLLAVGIPTVVLSIRRWRAREARK